MNEGFLFAVTVIWASLHFEDPHYQTLTLTQIAMVIEKGMPILLGFWKRGCPYHCSNATSETRRNWVELTFAKLSETVIGQQCEHSLKRFFCKFSKKKKQEKKIALSWPPTWRPCHLVATKNWLNILPSNFLVDCEQSLFFLQSVEQNARHANGHARD